MENGHSAPSLLKQYPDGRAAHGCDAYATFLMRNDSYLPGALVLAYALRNQSQKQLFCIVSEGVSKTARNMLSLLYNSVISLPELVTRSTVTAGRQDRSRLFTRFNALRLDGAARLVLLDADVLPLCRFDELFELPAPAGILMERKGFDLDASPHGVPIPKEITDRPRDDTQNMGVNSGLWRINPSPQAFAEVMRFIEDTDTSRFPWPEMQAATLMWSGRWTGVDARFCAIAGTAPVGELFGIHFAGLKPWSIRSKSIRHYAKHPDFRLWYGYWQTVCTAYPALRKLPMLERLYTFSISI